MLESYALLLLLLLVLVVVVGWSGVGWSGGGGGGGGADGVWMTYLWRYRITDLHRIRVIERLGVRLPASQPPWSPRALTAVSVRGLKSGRSSPRRTSAKNGVTTAKKTSVAAISTIDCECPEPCRCMTTDVQNELQLRRPPQFLHCRGKQEAAIFSTSGNCGISTASSTKPPEEPARREQQRHRSPYRRKTRESLWFSEQPGP